MADLITSAYLQQCATAAKRALSAAELVVAPTLITAASRSCRRHCNRYFNRTTFDGLYTLDQPGATLLLRQFPVNSIARLCTNPTPVLSVGNSDTTTNQRATAQLATSAVADIVDLPAGVTGLTLTRIASGASIPVSVPFSTNVTISAVAAAIVALGAGWTATVANGYGAWPSADLRAVQGAMPALGSNAATLKIHVDDLPFELVQETGEVVLMDGSIDPFNSIRFGPFLSTTEGDVQVYGGRNGLRCIYDAGWDTVPEDVQQACVELVLDMLGTLKVDQRLGSETVGSYGYVLNTAFAHYALPKSVLGRLAPYLSPRA